MDSRFESNALNLFVFSSIFASQHYISISNFSTNSHIQPHYKWPSFDKFDQIDQIRQISKNTNLDQNRIFYINFYSKFEICTHHLLCIGRVQSFYYHFTKHFTGVSEAFACIVRIISDHHWKLWSLITFVWAIRFS